MAVESFVDGHDFSVIARALGSTPRAAYSVPHVYPNAAPAFEERAGVVRERFRPEFMRLYVHIPFCNYSCSFCCYAKKVGSPESEMRRYVNALKKELEWVEPGTPVSQFFVGGGTPTALPADLLDEVLGAIQDRMPYYNSPIHTVEGSPESLSPAHIEVLKRRGVGRVSMGIQSLANDVLDTLHRGHDQNEAREACRRVMDAGLILNIDLMYGLPGQTIESFQKDFETAASAGVHAITAYSLRLNEHTPLSRTIDAEDQLSLERLIRWRTAVRDTSRRLGFAQTRWHTFKREGTIAMKHDRLPTRGSDGSGYQLGIGVSARSQLKYSVYRNHTHIKTYMDRIEAGESPVQAVFELDEADRRTQFIARAIGDGKPLSISGYEAQFGSSFERDYASVIARLGEGGLIASDGQSYILTETGKLVYDLVTLSFYPDHAREWLMERLKDYQVG